MFYDYICKSYTIFLEMIVNFSVKNFKSVKDAVTLSFEPASGDELKEYYLIEPTPKVKLLKLGLIYGSNGSGKTTILYALDFLRDLVVSPSEKKTDRFNFKPFLFDPETPAANTEFAIEFFQNQTRYEYEVELNRDAIIRERLSHYLTAKKSLVYQRNTDLQKKLTYIDFGARIKLNKTHKETLEANTLWNNTVLGGFLKTNIESKELQEVSDWFKAVLNPIITPKTNLLGFVSSKIEDGAINKANILTFLKKADFKISDIVVKEKEIALTEDVRDLIDFLNQLRRLPKEEAEKLATNKQIGKELWFKHTIDNNGQESAYEIEYVDESQGTQRYYQFSGLLDLLIRNKSVFFIDELESSLHPDLVKHFLLVFLANAEHAQLITTTHYRELLIERDILRHDAIWFTEKKSDEGTELFSLADFDSSVIRKDTGSIYNAYKTGKLGANPILKDYHVSLDE